MEPTEIESTTPPPQKYTSYTKNQRRLLTLILGLATTTSPLTVTIYFPLLPLLRDHFNTLSQAINLTITIYIVLQALSPAIFGPLSDSLGRRPVYLFTLLLYVVGNLGLASLGASAAYAVSFGVVADVCVPSERGSMIGPVSMALNLGACIGPALVIVGGVLFSGVAIFLPETARQIVGDGSSRKNKTWWYNSLWSLLRTKYRASTTNEEREGDPIHEVGDEKSLLKKIQVQNPLACLRIIFHYDTFLALWMHGSFYTVDYSMVAVLPDIYQNIYQFNALQIGLSYLPRGAGIIFGGYCNGKLMDHNYRVTASQIGFKIDKVAGDDLTRFPLGRARSRGSYILLAISTATLIGYGWGVTYHVHISVLMILQFVQGFWGTCFYTIYNTLLVDIYPQSPSTAAATASILRCAMAATEVAVLQPLLDNLGRGWYFTILGLWSGIFGAAAVYLLRTKGMQWRTERMQRQIS